MQVLCPPEAVKKCRRNKELARFGVFHEAQGVKKADTYARCLDPRAATGGGRGGTPDRGETQLQSCKVGGCNGSPAAIQSPAVNDSNGSSRVSKLSPKPTFKFERQQWRET